MKLYISGPISHYPNDNREAFDLAELILNNAGYEAVSPFISELNHPDYPDKHLLKYEDYLTKDLEILLKCDGVAVLSGAEWSEGSRLEVDVALRLKKPVLSIMMWLSKAGINV